MELRPQALQARLDQAPLELGGLHRHLVRLPLALLHLRRVVARDRHAGDHRIDQQIPIEPFEEELPDAVRRPGCRAAAGSSVAARSPAACKPIPSGTCQPDPPGRSGWRPSSRLSTQKIAGVRQAPGVPAAASRRRAPRPTAIPPARAGSRRRHRGWSRAAATSRRIRDDAANTGRRARRPSNVVTRRVKLSVGAQPVQDGGPVLGNESAERRHFGVAADVRLEVRVIRLRKNPQRVVRLPAALSAVSQAALFFSARMLLSRSPNSASVGVRQTAQHRTRIVKIQPPDDRPMGIVGSAGESRRRRSHPAGKAPGALPRIRPIADPNARTGTWRFMRSTICSTICGFIPRAVISFAA